MASLRPAFTLIELLVVMVIISILASLSLAGLRGSRQRSKIEKTKSTIRKIDNALRPMFDSYRTRRFNTASIADPTSAQCSKCYTGSTLNTLSAAQWKKLIATRNAMVVDMPDCWEDVPTRLSDIPTYAQSAAVKAYIASASTARRAANGSAETLFLIASRSGYDPEALEEFRNDETADTDGDGATEFIDGWGKPIIFLRWAPGFLKPMSPIQEADADTLHDPLDPMKLDYDASDRTKTGYALMPLIVSGGPDEATALTVLSGGWLAAAGTPPVLSTIVVKDGSKLIGSAASDNPTGYRDNITNHDLIKK